jgi:hypothetical protein
MKTKLNTPFSADIRRISFIASYRFMNQKYIEDSALQRTRGNRIPIPPSFWARPPKKPIFSKKKPIFLRFFEVKINYFTEIALVAAMFCKEHRRNEGEEAGPPSPPLAAAKRGRG